MSLPPESIEVGRCYLVEGRKILHVRQVVRLMPNGWVQYEFRPAHLLNVGAWQPGMQDSRSFAFSSQREVPCDWTPETDDKEQGMR